MIWLVRSGRVARWIAMINQEVEIGGRLSRSGCLRLASVGTDR